MNTNVLDVIMQTVTWMHTGYTDFVQIFELVPVTQKELNFFGYSAKKTNCYTSMLIALSIQLNYNFLEQIIHIPTVGFKF